MTDHDRSTEMSAPETDRARSTEMSAPETGHARSTEMIAPETDRDRSTEMIGINHTEEKKNDDETNPLYHCLTLGHCRK